MTETRGHRCLTWTSLVLLATTFLVLWAQPTQPAPAAAARAGTGTGTGLDLNSLIINVPAMVPDAHFDKTEELTAKDLSSGDTPGAEIVRALYVAGRGWVYNVGERQIVVELLEARTAQAAAVLAEAQGTGPSGVAPDSWRDARMTGRTSRIGYAGSVGRLAAYVGVFDNGPLPEVPNADALALRLYLTQRGQLPVLDDLSDEKAQAIGHQFGYTWGIGNFIVVLLGVLTGFTLSVATDRGSREWWRARRASTASADHRRDLTQRVREEWTFTRIVPLARGAVLAGIVGVATAWPSLHLWEAGLLVVAFVLAWALIETWLRSRQAGSELAHGMKSVVVTALGAGFGSLLIVAGVSMMVAAIAGLIERSPSATPIVVLGLLVLGMEIINWSRRPVRLAKRLLQPRVREQVKHDGRAPLLLLRSFQDDALEVRPPSALVGAVDTFAGEARVRFEEIIAWTAWSRGPLRTFGQPGTTLQPLGAARDYHDDSNWEEAIRALGDQAQAILLMVGRSPSLIWEIAEIRLRARLARTIFVFPPVDEAETARRVATICAALDLDKRLLDPGRHRRLLALGFDEAGTPTTYVAAGRSSDAYVLAVTEALALVSKFDLAGSPAAWARRDTGDPMADVEAFDPTTSTTQRRTVISRVSTVLLSFVPI